MNCRVESASWRMHKDELLAIRWQVFVDEQGVPADLEQDAYDHDAHHVVARTNDDLAIGTGRLLTDGHIGRMAVLAAWRGRGVGTALLHTLLDVARSRGIQRVALNAQVSAIPFYEKAGFRAECDIFDDAGIPHQRMTLTLSAS